MSLQVKLFQRKWLAWRYLQRSSDLWFKRSSQEALHFFEIFEYGGGIQNGHFKTDHFKLRVLFGTLFKCHI